MQKFLASALLAFLLATSGLFTVSARSLLDVFAEEAKALSNAVDVNELSYDEPAEVEVPPQKPRKKTIKPFVITEMDAPDNVKVLQGESLTLTCTVHSNPQATVHWIRGADPRKQIDNLLKESVAWSSSEWQKRTFVTLKSKHVIDCANGFDQGPIHCVAIAGDNYSYQSTTISVEKNLEGTRVCPMDVAPVITNSLTQILSEIGKTVILPCTAVGSPRPKIHWVDFSMQAIASDPESHFQVLPNGSLMISDLQWEHMGGYTCNATSYSGTVRTETFVYPTMPPAH